MSKNVIKESAFDLCQTLEVTIAVIIGSI